MDHGHRRWLGWCWGLSVLASLAGEPPNLVSNGDFEDTKEDKPTAWQWHVANGARATMALDHTVLRSGAVALRLSSDSPHAPHVYGTLCQRIDGLQPRQVYTVSLWARGEGVGVCWIGGGPKWDQRFPFPTGTYGWRQLSGEVETGPGETWFDLRLNVDSVTRGLWVDDVEFRLLRPSVPNGIVTRIAANDLAAARLYPVFRVAAGRIRVDGDLADWESLAAPLCHLPGTAARLSYPGYAGATDLGAELRLAYDEQAIWVAVVVTDDVFCQPVGGAMAWHYDNVQLAFDPAYDRASGGYADDDREWGLTLGPDGPEAYQWAPVPMARPAGVTVAARRLGSDRVAYEARLEWTALGGPPPQHGRALGFDILVNDSDNDERHYFEWTEGVGYCKDPAAYATLILVDPDQAAAAPAALIRPDRPVFCETDPIAGGLWFVANVTAERVPVSLNLDETTEITRVEVEVPLLVNSVRFCLLPESVSAGYHTVSARVGDRGRAEARLEKSTGVALAREGLAAVESDLPALEELLGQAEAAGIPTDYQRLRWRTAKLFVEYGRDDLAHGEVERAVRVARALAAAVKEARDSLLLATSGGPRPPAVPRFRTGPIEIAGGSFIADAEISATGVRARQPVFFTGYGHFGRVREHLPIFQDLACNLIQIESGPTSTLPAEDRVDTAGVRAHVVQALELGQKHHVAVCVLVSPHYFPEWALQKWPALRGYKGGFFHHSLDAPEARAVQEKHLQVLLEQIRAFPSLHSICLSNEPIYQDCRADAATRPLWTDFLGQTFGTVAEANAAWATKYARFEDVPVPHGEVPADETQLAEFNDWCRFNMERFAAWHAWEATVVRQIAPQVPCHAKIMPTILERRTIGWGVDPERFARLSQINGNDCWEFYDHSRSGKWAFNWLSMGMFYDLQSAMAAKPIYNSENHIIVDRDQRPIPPGHTYTAIWQGAIHGQGATTSWVWERTYDPKSDFAGSILHRPENVIAHGEAGLDLMRLAREVTALQQAPRQVALLYSVTSLIHDLSYLDVWARAYTALSFAGIAVGYRSERQAAAGDWGETRVLIVPAARYVTAPARAGIRRWGEAGGRVVFIGSGALGLDPHRRPFPDQPGGTVPASVLSVDLTEQALRDALLEAVQAAGCPLPLSVHGTDGRLPWGVEWRSCEAADGSLVNLINLTREPLTVRLGTSDTAWRDLISGRELPLDVALLPLRPVLALARR